MWLFVGLGNPGPEYQDNRHNIGFMAVDRIVHRHDFGAWRATKFNAMGALGTLAGEQVLAVKPTTYMNESGQAVGAIMRFYKAVPANIVVFHDELDLESGKLRAKLGGGHGGHNGLRSIDAHIGPAYRRIRLGIGHPGSKERVLGHVLGNFSNSDRNWLDPLLDAMASEAPAIIERDEQVFASRVHHLITPQREKPPRPPNLDKKPLDKKSPAEPTAVKRDETDA
jgi:PTH1 family peptidyl-tRNA hydrolase